MNKEVQELFEENLHQSTLKSVEKDKLVFSSPQGNHKRSRLGEKWFYFGETTDSYTLFHDEIEGEDTNHYFVRLYQDGESLTDDLIAIGKKEFSKRYPVQMLFSHSMEETEALAVLKTYFKDQSERSTTIS